MSFTQEQYESRLRGAGYKMTNARKIIWQAISEHKGHFTSSEILDAVGILDASIGRASVFRTLDLLTQLGIIRPTYIDSNVSPRYVLLPNGHHHHIICMTCNRVIEFDECGLEALTKKLEERYNLKLTGHLLEFYGVCGDCDSD